VQQIHTFLALKFGTFSTRKHVNHVAEHDEIYQEIQAQKEGIIHQQN
jgi:hypothetical protein